MFLKIFKNKVLNLYTNDFYMFSCLANLVSAIFAYFVIPDYCHSLSIFGVILFLGMLGESIVKKSFTNEEYNSRYSVKILYEIFLVIISMVLMKNEYLLYLPILLSMLYLNVNTIIKSKFLKYVSYIFMLSPIFKIVSMESKDILAYVSVCVMFIFISILSSILFQSNSEMIEESNRREHILKEIYKLTNRHKIHDVRNELTKLYMSAYKHSENDPGTFMKILKESSENIQRYTNADIFKNDEKIDLETLIEDLHQYSTFSEINYTNSFIDRRQIVGNRNFLSSLIKRLLENCVEKSRAQNSPGDVILIKRENILIFIDECGTTVSDSFRDFLSVVQDPTVESIFQFRVHVQELKNGFEYKIIFQKTP